MLKSFKGIFLTMFLMFAFVNIAYAQEEESNSRGASIIKDLNKIKNEHINSTDQNQEQSAKLLSAKLAESLSGLILAILPVLRLAGIVLLVLAIKKGFLDEPQRHGGAISVAVSSSVRFLLAVVLINSHNIYDWWITDIKPNLGDGVSGADFLMLGYVLVMAFARLLGVFTIAYAAYFAAKPSETREFPIMKVILYMLGGILLLNLPYIVGAIMGDRI